MSHPTIPSATPSDREFLVTSFQALTSGDLFALVLRVKVAQPIEWVRTHADELAALGVQQDARARGLNAPIVALNVEYA